MNAGLNSKRRHRANAQFISIPARGGFMYGEGGGLQKDFLSNPEFRYQLTLVHYKFINNYSFDFLQTIGCYFPIEN